MDLMYDMLFIFLDIVAAIVLILFPQESLLFNMCEHLNAEAQV